MATNLHTWQAKPRISAWFVRHARANFQSARSARAIFLWTTRTRSVFILIHFFAVLFKRLINKFDVLTWTLNFQFSLWRLMRNSCSERRTALLLDNNIIEMITWNNVLVAVWRANWGIILLSNSSQREIFKGYAIHAYSRKGPIERRREVILYNQRY